MCRRNGAAFAEGGHRAAEIGAPWAEVVRPNNVLTVTTGPSRQKRPRKEIEAVMGRRRLDAPHAYIRNYVLEMTPYFDWQA